MRIEESGTTTSNKAGTSDNVSDGTDSASPITIPNQQQQQQGFALDVDALMEARETNSIRATEPPTPIVQRKESFVTNSGDLNSSGTTSTTNNQVIVPRSRRSNKSSESENSGVPLSPSLTALNTSNRSSIGTTRSSSATTTTTTTTTNRAAAVIIPRSRLSNKSSESENLGVPLSPSLTGLNTNPKRNGSSSAAIGDTAATTSSDPKKGSNNSPQERSPRRALNTSFDSIASLEPDQMVQRTTNSQVEMDEATKKAALLVLEEEEAKLNEKAQAQSIRSISTGTSSSTAAALGPHSREAREQRKMKQQQQQQMETESMDGVPPPVASMPSVATTSSNDTVPSSNSTSSDLQAALALARQDLQAKTNQQEATAEAVADQRRKAGEETEEEVEEPPPPPPPQPRVPVGAFRINPSTSGRFAIQSAADADISVSPTEATPSTNNTPPTTAAAIVATTPVIESDMVLESTLVEEYEENRAARRRNRRSGGGSTETTNNNGGSSSEANHTTGSAATTAMSTANATVDEENPTTSPSSVPAASAAIMEEAAPPPPTQMMMIVRPPDDSLVITAETPTLNDSVWTLLKSRKGRWGIFILIALVATLTVLGVTVWEKKNVEININPPTTNNPTTSPSSAPSISWEPTSVPTMAPTTEAPTAAPTIRQFALTDLPNETIALIQTEPDSPQARAWKWIENDDIPPPGDGRIPQAEQTLQRFVLVTLYYATNGPGWQFQRYWLDHDTSECDWWPHVTGVTWPYNQGPRVCTLRGGYTFVLLAENSLKGTLPSELALLPYLRILDVSNNPGLTGEVPSEVCDVMALDDNVEVQISCAGDDASSSDLTCDCGCTCVERRLIEW